MKRTIIKLALLIGFSTIAAAESEVSYEDSLMPFVSEEKPIEDILIDAFIALPQDYFQGTVRQLALAVHHHATNPSVSIDTDAKTVRLDGDGGQATVEMNIIEWRQGFLKVVVRYSHESTDFTETLTRTKTGWTRHDNHDKENEAEEPTSNPLSD